MKKAILEVGRMLLCVAIVPALSLSLLSCEPENDGEGTLPPGVTPEVSVPDGYVNYFIEDLSFSRSAGEAKVAFQINVDWSMEVVAPEGGSASWLSVGPASGDAGLHKVIVRVTANKVSEVRTATIQLMSGKSKVAEILVTQERYRPEGAVDLGLSVAWASCNVGASYPEDYGDYFAWGETTTKSSYTESNSVTFDLSISELESRGIIGSDGNLTATYDAATVNWGSPWRMPTLDEIKELIDNCTWSWTTLNRVKGYKATGPNGNSIFFPAAGGRDKGAIGLDSNGLYWSSTPSKDDSERAYYLWYLCDSGVKIHCFGRDSGYTVRPVTE